MKPSTLLLFTLVSFVAVLTTLWATTGVVDYYRPTVIALGVSTIVKILSP